MVALPAAPPVTATVPAIPVVPAPGEALVSYAAALPAGSVEIDAGGDVTFGGVVGDLIAQRGLGWPWQYVTPVFAHADMSFVNMEGTVSNRGSPEPKQYTYRGDPAVIPAMAAAGVTVVTVANNHSLDFGPDALIDTVGDLASAGIAPVGGGADDAHAWEPAVVTKKGVRVAFVAATRILPAGWAAGATTPGVASAYDERRLLAAVRGARARSDFVVAAIHWGTEGATDPGLEQVHLAHALIDAGAGLVLGAHPHVLQPVVTYKGGVIAYSLGNLVFTASGVVQTSMILRVGVQPGGGPVVGRVPIRIESGQPRPAA